MYCSTVASATRQDRIVLAVDRAPQAACGPGRAAAAAAAAAARTSFDQSTKLSNTVIMKLHGQYVHTYFDRTKLLPFV